MCGTEIEPRTIIQSVDELFAIGAVNPQTRRDVLDVSARLDGLSGELIMLDQKTAGTVFVRRRVVGDGRGDLEVVPFADITAGHRPVVILAPGGRHREASEYRAVITHVVARIAVTVA